MEAIRTEGLTKRYRELTAVEKLALTVEQGELFALLGVNGAGKTTTVKMLATLTAPSSGDGYLMGYSIREQAGEVKKIIGLSPQETAVAVNLTVEENLRFMCGAHGFDKQKTAAKTEEMMKEFSLLEIRDRRAGKLSGGWQRRLSIAMALIGEPKVLFLDEPTLGLDVIARSELWDSIRALKGRVPTVLTTHYMEEAEMLSDRIGIMKDGRLLTVGTPAELKSRTGCDRFEDAFIAIVKGEKA